MYYSTNLTPEQHADLFARARCQAQVLRRAAIADFWRSVFRLGARALRAAQPVQQTDGRLRAIGSRKPTGV